MTLTLKISQTVLRKSVGDTNEIGQTVSNTVVLIYLSNLIQENNLTEGLGSKQAPLDSCVGYVCFCITVTSLM